MFSELPSQDYITGCIAPFALSPEVTEVIHQDTLGGMISCDFDVIMARFENFFEPGAAAPGQAPAEAPTVATPIA